MRKHWPQAIFIMKGIEVKKRIFLQYFYVVLKEKNDENIINFKFFIIFFNKVEGPNKI